MLNGAGWRKTFSSSSLLLGVFSGRWRRRPSFRRCCLRRMDRVGGERYESRWAESGEVLGSDVVEAWVYDDTELRDAKSSSSSEVSALRMPVSTLDRAL